jgi:hypothetical protein
LFQFLLRYTHCPIIPDRGTVGGVFIELFALVMVGPILMPLAIMIALKYRGE